MLHKKLEKLIPHLTDNVISYDLWEEGHYNIPFVHFFVNKNEIWLSCYIFILRHIEFN